MVPDEEEVMKKTRALPAWKRGGASFLRNPAKTRRAVAAPSALLLEEGMILIVMGILGCVFCTVGTVLMVVLKQWIYALILVACTGSLIRTTIDAIIDR